VGRVDSRGERGRKPRRDRDDHMAERAGAMSETTTFEPRREGRPRILVVDDEAHLADGIRENLEAEGYATDVAHDGLEGLEKIRRERYDLVLLDVMMPKMNGLEVCEAIRKEGVQTPVMFLTVKGDPEDRIRGLEAGGDDYLAKPFHLRELLLRVAAILRRNRWYAETESTLEFGGNRIDFET